MCSSLICSSNSVNDAASQQTFPETLTATQRPAQVSSWSSRTTSALYSSLKPLRVKWRHAGLRSAPGCGSSLAGAICWRSRQRWGGGYRWIVRRKFWKAEEFLKLTPAEQDALFAASIITDLTQAPPELLAVARARLQHRIDSSEIHFDVSPGRPNMFELPAPASAVVGDERRRCAGRN
jgi:hypothetical protein